MPDSVSPIEATKFAVKAFVTWRGALMVLSWMAMHLASPYRAASERPQLDSIYWSSHARFDSRWYSEIARDGYYIKPNKSNTPFFPLYPLACRWLTPVFGTPEAAGIVISHLALLVAIGFLYRIGCRLYSPELAQQAIVYLLLFPSAYFFSMMYTESLFLLWTSIAFWAFLERRMWLAGLAGMLAGLTRSSAMVLFFAFVGALAWRWYRQKSRPPWSALALGLIPCSWLLYAAYLNRLVGEPFAFYTYQAKFWHRRPTFPLATWWRHAKKVDLSLPSDSNMHDAMRLGFPLVGLSLAVSMAVSGAEPAMWLYLAGGCLYPLTTGLIMGLTRFVLVLFPAQFEIARLTRRAWLQQLVLISYTFVLAVLYTRFLSGRFND